MLSNASWVGSYSQAAYFFIIIVEKIAYLTAGLTKVEELLAVIKTLPFKNEPSKNRLLGFRAMSSGPEFESTFYQGKKIKNLNFFT